MKTLTKKKILTVLYSVLAAILVVLLFFANFCVPFMMDDEWYSTNLVTGERLHGIKDVIESQWWHYNNWGGRTITHGILQFVLMGGNLFADFLNTIFTMVLAFLICLTSFLGLSEKQKNAALVSYPRFITTAVFLISFSALFAYNPNIKMSMLWEAGCVNYVYSSVWIFCFVFAFLRIAENPESKDLPLINFWMIPLSVMSGWSNENMGPTCFLLSVFVIILNLKKSPASNKKEGKSKVGIRPWMIIGAIGSLIGSILCIIAPGNFVRVAEIDKQPLLKEISDRILSMVNGAGNYLFLSVITLAVLMIFTHAVCKMDYTISEILLIICIILSYGAMILSPHYPDRASFGTMTLCITAICQQIIKLNLAEKEKTPVIPLTTIFAGLLSIVAAMALTYMMIF